MKIGVVTPVMKGGEQGGAEVFYGGLVQGLRRASYDVDQITVSIDETTFETILESYVSCHDLDLSQYDLVISTKAPTYMIRHPNHISYLVHTIRVFYDMFHQAFGEGAPEHHIQRRIIHTLDKYALHPDRVRRYFTIGHTPYARLREADTFWQKIAYQVLPPPPALEYFKEPRPGEYIFLPGRLHRWKRVDLVIRAFKHVKHDIPLKIAGIGEDEAALRELAAGDPRIEFLGYVSDEQLLDLYTKALVVPFVPVHEDYGFITVEAFRSKKPVITCTDSGEPTYFVKNFETGFVVPPDPVAIAEKVTFCIEHPDQVAEMGENGWKATSHITWYDTITTLLTSIEHPKKRERIWIQSPVKKRAVQVLITDNQCIEPAVGGGRLRLLGLYSTLAEGLEATYVGTYDWPGPQYREIQLSQRLREIDIPLSDEHFALNAHLNALLPEKTIIDVTIPWLIQSSQALAEAVQKHAREADVIICSHPWMYGCLRDLVNRTSQLLIYDSQNCEALLREKLLGSPGLGDFLVQSVRKIEGQLCQESDLILACSTEDKQAFIDLYGVKPGKVIIMPNGADVETIRPASLVTRVRAKVALSITSFTALFIGSAYPPNIEAAQTIIDKLAPANPDVTFLIVGGVCERLKLGNLDSNVQGASNVKLLGGVNNEQRNLAYAAADIAINPMFAGSGTNIKMLDFFAAGLPTIATPIGARGIVNRGDACFIVDNIDKFNFWLNKLGEDRQLYSRLAYNSRKLVEDEYNWQDLSGQLGEVILELLTLRGIAREPYFSVVIPSYERPHLLTKLLLLLNNQTFKNFEVIVVDQSPEPLIVEGLRCNFVLQYIHTQEKGAVKARNTGIKQAKGQIIAFTDDDCEPDSQWLAKAHEYFKDRALAGIEGIIKSDQKDETRYRIVTNEGLEGLGFMTANLFLRKEVVDKIEGFDERFDHPHFREDTDIAWRALAYGKIPFAHDVQVVHPAHPRNIQRESSQERATFFVQDPLLFHKHPERYIQLMKAERHYAKTPGFWEYFLEGLERYKVSFPLEDLRNFAPPEQFSMLWERMKLFGLIRALVEQFNNLLSMYKPIDLGVQVDPVDAFFTYRLLLRRNPDPLMELPQILSNPLTFREFLRHFMDSPEFGYTGGFMPAGQLLMANVEGFRFWFNTGDREMGVLMGFGLYEPQSVALLKKLVKPGMKCLDIGAQTGFYTCLLATCVGDAGKIYAFEPMPSSYELLNRNVRENHFEDRVVTFPFAASNAPTHLEGSIVSNMYVIGDVPGADKVPMETVRIDDIVKDRIDLIKMDVEGHELAVVEGMRSLIMRDRPILLTEVNEYWLQTLSHTSSNGYLDLLLSLGYSVFTEKDMETPLKHGNLNLDILGSVNVVAFPC